MSDGRRQRATELGQDGDSHHYHVMATAALVVSLARLRQRSKRNSTAATLPCANCTLRTRTQTQHSMHILKLCSYTNIVIYKYDTMENSIKTIRSLIILNLLALRCPSLRNIMLNKALLHSACRTTLAQVHRRQQHISALQAPQRHLRTSRTSGRHLSATYVRVEPAKPEPAAERITTAYFNNSQWLW